VKVTVSELAVTAVKGTRLRTVPSVELGPTGACGDRRFYVIDEHGRMLNAKRLGKLEAVIAYWCEDSRELALEFPGGVRIAGAVEHGGTVRTQFFSSEREATLVAGPWSEALSEFLGLSLQLVETDSAVDRGTAGGAVSLISRASLTRLAEVAEAESVDGRRFRMLIEIDGVPPHAEDRWVGRQLRIGDAVLRWNGHVGRCLVTNRNPDSGEVDFPTLVMLARYRLGLDTTERLPFGIYGEVISPGTISVGDSAEPFG
jgi:uncharacterized protein